MPVLTSINNTIAGGVTEAIADSFVAQLNADRLSLATALAAGAPPDRSAVLQAKLATLRLPLQAVERPVGAHELKAISYYGPAMALFFVLFLVGYTARGYFVERDQGMLERMRVAPVRPLDVLAGKSLSVFVFGFVDLLVIAAFTSAEDRAVTSVHEAAHVVLYLAAGYGVEYIEIHPADSLRPGDPKATTMVRGGSGPWLEYALAMAAGERAADRWVREAGLWSPLRGWALERLAAGDRVRVAEAVRAGLGREATFLGRRDDPADYAWICDRADEALDEHYWPKVVALGRHLVSHHRVSGAEAARVAGL